jgi:hypothetical protein
VQSKKYLPYKVRLFVDHLRTWFRDTDWKSPDLDNQATNR